MAWMKFVGGLLASLLCVAPARAQGVADFYKGKNLSLVIPNAPGGSFDLYARLVADNIGRFIPGHPAIVPQNMPGAGGMQAANYLTSIAPRVRPCAPVPKAAYRPPTSMTEGSWMRVSPVSSGCGSAA